MEENNIKELITRRRRQILIHSHIYYFLCTSIIDDKTFDTWARELVRLQNENPEISKLCPFYEDFKDFDATTGFHLKSVNNPDIAHRAERLLFDEQDISGRKDRSAK